MQLSRQLYFCRDGIEFIGERDGSFSAGEVASVRFRNEPDDTNIVTAQLDAETQEYIVITLNGVEELARTHANNYTKGKWGNEHALASVQLLHDMASYLYD